ncbi:carotenoid cleavage dioxygenase 1 [Aspergillus nomiae NRRL 13137]|uniref:Carotenoid cleavage dioxygenase 1 n=1 Tax=Aspergillus nomiae NRRL (strain ATCC 15546 / NRRL 13137 / CBS 260.88 / M93) TaxID=1509407 RepID=A0A0L1J8N2_ASPN3|nr:carotenoid cleavage dioxygenase 1 [Aspergillus nomiae NRRL 13137]KNG87773.1 carotenoid cleavage dioxygenase 1 [Aspergillus nomiae NRRL 13137]
MEQKKRSQHRYLSGNFAPVSHTAPLQPCRFMGEIPDELRGGQYVRNGGNPVVTHDLTRKAHWFDGDGMLNGVYFRPCSDRDGKDIIQPEFVNQYALTDVYFANASGLSLEEPMNPSIALFLDPQTTLTEVITKAWNFLKVAMRSYFGGFPNVIKRISVANTGVIYHDGRALATCEIGPPLRVSLPELETVGWFNGINAEGEIPNDTVTAGFGDHLFFKFFQEFTTGHPHVDPQSDELILFHSIYVPPYVTYSVIPRRNRPLGKRSSPMFNIPVKGISRPKLMHDFGVSHQYTIIIDLPILFSPTNLLREESLVTYCPDKETRFGVFPRYNPEAIRWFHTEPCCIFHTVNSWDVHLPGRSESPPVAINMLCCRMTGPSMIFNTGDIEIPPGSVNHEINPECRLYFYQFDLSSPWNVISQQWALSAIGYEFPHVPRHSSMSATRWVYGCSTVEGSFGIALGKALKIDCLVKIDAKALIAKGLKEPPEQVTGCVDNRSVKEILAQKDKDSDDPIRIYQMPTGWYAQECSFVPRHNAEQEDDGWLLTFVFDESQLSDAGEALDTAKSELWILNAKDMNSVVARIILPQRVPYGIHGNWFSEEEIQSQHPVQKYRGVPRQQI